MPHWQNQIFLLVTVVLALFFARRSHARAMKFEERSAASRDEHATNPGSESSFVEHVMRSGEVVRTTGRTRVRLEDFVPHRLPYWVDVESSGRRAKSLVRRMWTGVDRRTGMGFFTDSDWNVPVKRPLSVIHRLVGPVE